MGSVTSSIVGSRGEEEACESCCDPSGGVKCPVEATAAPGLPTKRLAGLGAEAMRKRQGAELGVVDVEMLSDQDGQEQE